MSNPTETLDEKIDRVLKMEVNRDLFTRTSPSTNKGSVTKILYRIANYGFFVEEVERSNGRNKSKEDFDLRFSRSRGLSTIGTLMSLPSSELTDMPYMGSKLIETMNQAFHRLMEIEFGITKPLLLFKSSVEAYENPHEVIYDFVTNPKNYIPQIDPPKMSMIFNLNSFRTTEDDNHNFTIDTHLGLQSIWISIGNDDRKNLTLYVAEDNSGRNIKVADLSNGSGECEVNDCHVTVARTGNDFRLDIVQRLG